MKKLTCILLTAALALGCMTGCGSGTAENTAAPAQSTADEKELKIVTTIFPEYDWVRQILGENAGNAELTLLLDNGVDLHSYQPTADDILKISDCDMFIYVGGESDGWVKDALAEATNKDMKVIDLMEELGTSAKEEEIKEGMQADEHEHEHEEHEHEEHEEHEHEEEGDEPEYDEHVWLSLKNAETLCSVITDGLCEIDPENEEAYRANLAGYTQQLSALDSSFSELAANAENKTLIFADRFPFRYFTDDYGLDYYAAFVGCSAETEASFDTVVFLAGKTDELNCKTVYTIDGSDGRIAQAVIGNSKAKDAQTAVLDSMQSTTGKDIENGADYLSIMQKNYEVLKGTLK